MPLTTNREGRRAAAKYMAQQNRKRPDYLVPLPREQWPEWVPPGLLIVYASREYLVQVFNEAANGVLVRLSINRTSITPSGEWQQDIPWEDLQRLKREAGYGDLDAVEVFPRDRDVVNVANMRHLWVLADPLAFAWRDR